MKLGRRIIVSIIFISTIAACKSTAVTESEQKVEVDEAPEMQERLKSSDDGQMTGQIIEKDFVNKINEPTGDKELYFRASIQDYFIKICESDVEKEVVQSLVNKTVTVKADIVDGNWDICPEDIDYMQSRVGPYMVIRKIL